MFPRPVTTVVCLALASGVAGAGAAPSAKRPTACKMLAAALHATVVDTYVKPDPGNNAINCTHSDGKPVAKSKWSVRLFFVPYPSVAVAKKAWEASYRAARAMKGPEPVRLRRIGADDAWGTEGELPAASAGPLTSAGISWRKGVYVGGFNLTAPTASNLGDLEEATDLIPPALRLLPRT